ncbi:Fic family protein [bacterium]|nr:Fic family protein [bacterium]
MKKRSSYDSGNYRQNYEYQSFLPTLVNREYIWSDMQIPILVEKAVHCLGELNAYAELIPDVDFIIKMHVTKEATTSSKIEGTKTSIIDAVMPVNEISPESRNDWEEVHNYIRAMNYAVTELKSLPLSMRLLKEAHKILLSGVRGHYKDPGEIRRSQNWIGGSSLKDAIFIPPHPEDLPDLLTDLEKFWHNKHLSTPNLIKIAISHYQFETIHPFLDGNGRMGRLLITLQLVQQKILSKPSLYLSDYFERNRSLYYTSLTTVRNGNDLDQWINFFLSGMIESSRKAKETLGSILLLRQKYDERILSMGKKANQAHKLLLFLFSNPVVSITQTAQYLGVSFPAASRAIQDFIDFGFLTELTGHSRNRLFELTAYLNLFR